MTDDLIANLRARLLWLSTIEEPSERERNICCEAADALQQQAHEIAALKAVLAAADNALSEREAALANWHCESQGCAVPEAYTEEARLYAENFHKMKADLAAAERDAARLNWLDSVNAKTNERNGTVYGWRFDINHNRAALSDHNLPALSVRAAIDRAMEEK